LGLNIHPGTEFLEDVIKSSLSENGLLENFDNIEDIKCQCIVGLVNMLDPSHDHFDIEDSQHLDDLKACSLPILFLIHEKNKRMLKDLDKKYHALDRLEAIEFFTMENSSFNILIYFRSLEDQLKDLTNFYENYRYINDNEYPYDDPVEKRLYLMRLANIEIRKRKEYVRKKVREIKREISNPKE